MWNVVVFLVFAILAVVAGINLVVQTHPISSALSLIGVMGSLAALYLLLGAEFLAAAQLIVYAGAIMVLFVFVIMLLNAGAEDPRGLGSRAKYFGVPLLIAFLGILSFIIQAVVPRGEGVAFGVFHGGPRDVGKSLFTDYLLPFEVVSVLILIAIIGAIVLAHREIE